jgi:hypothetical protein
MKVENEKMIRTMIEMEISQSDINRDDGYR